MSFNVVGAGLEQLGNATLGVAGLGAMGAAGFSAAAAAFAQAPAGTACVAAKVAGQRHPDWKSAGEAIEGAADFGLGCVALGITGAGAAGGGAAVAAELPVAASATVLRGAGRALQGRCAWMGYSSP